MDNNLKLNFTDDTTAENNKPTESNNSGELQLLSIKLSQAIANPLFPKLDNDLRSGKHINSEELEFYEFLLEYQYELEEFYNKYNVELIKAPEAFFYLRPKASSIIARSVLSELEMLVGKVLCYLYLSPEKLAQQGIFTTQDVYDELLNLTDEIKLLKLINIRSAGSDLDKQKLAEKVRSSLNRLKRMGMIKPVGDFHSNKFVISETVFRFGADVRADQDPLEAQRKLIREGEAIEIEALKKHNQFDDDLDLDVNITE